MRCNHIYRDTPRSQEKGRVGQQCKAAAVNRTPYCKFHGGNSEQVINKAREERYVEVVQGELVKREFTDLWPEDHAKLDPFSLLLWEIRRSGARIEWFDEKIAELEDEKSIWWGKSKEEVIGAAEFTGTNKTFEARENVLVKMQNEERKVLKSLRDEWQNNRFEALKVAGYGAFRASMRAAIGAILVEFELDPTSEDVQNRLRSCLEALPEPIMGIEAPDHKELNKAQ